MSDSVWSMVLGIAKTFNQTPQFALYGISYRNAILYSKAMPMYGDGETDKGSGTENYRADLDASDPANAGKFASLGFGIKIEE